jgi:hypothetical protein
MPVVEAQVKAAQVLRAAGADARHQFFRRDAFGFGFEHDGRAMAVVGADEMNPVALHALEAHPDVRLDVLHDVPDMKRTVGVGQGGGDEKVTRRAHRAWENPAGEGSRNYATLITRYPRGTTEEFQAGSSGDVFDRFELGLVDGLLVGLLAVDHALVQ